MFLAKLTLHWRDDLFGHSQQSEFSKTDALLGLQLILFLKSVICHARDEVWSGIQPVERAQSEIAWKVTKIHLWQGSMKITFYCFAHRRKVKPLFDIMRAQTRLQVNYERNSYKFPRILVKLKFLRKKYHTNVSSRGQNSSLVEFPLGVWSFRCNFHVRSINVFNSGKLTMISSRFPEPQWNSNVLCLTLSRRHEFSAKQTTNQTSVFIRKQRSLCILLHPQARIFRCVKFSKLIPTAKPMGKEVFTC